MASLFITWYCWSWIYHSATILKQNSSKLIQDTDSERSSVPPPNNEGRCEQYKRVIFTHKHMRWPLYYKWSRATLFDPLILQNHLLNSLTTCLMKCIGNLQLWLNEPYLFLLQAVIDNLLFCLLMITGGNETNWQSSCPLFQNPSEPPLSIHKPHPPLHARPHHMDNHRYFK
jgi:hypothetical protein